MNDGDCIDGQFSFTCNCTIGFTGLTCEESKYETELKRPGMILLMKINVLIRNVEDLMNLFTFLDINDCDPNPCQNNGECVDGMATYTCNCPFKVYGPNCEISKYRKKYLKLYTRPIHCSMFIVLHLVF